MPDLILIAGINGTGRSSFRGVLKGLSVNLGQIIGADLIAQRGSLSDVEAGRVAISEIRHCLANRLTFTQETTLAGNRTAKMLQTSLQAGYHIVMYYIGLNSEQESIVRIANRVHNGGHNIPTADVVRRFENRRSSLEKVLPYCHEIHFFDNTNGFIKVAELNEKSFSLSAEHPPRWMEELVPTIIDFFPTRQALPSKNPIAMFCQNQNSSSCDCPNRER